MKRADNKNGAHHCALRRKSVNVLLGAINVFTMRAPSDNGAAASGAGGGGATGRAAMATSKRQDCNLERPTAQVRGLLPDLWRWGLPSAPNGRGQAHLHMLHSNFRCGLQQAPRVSVPWP